MAKYCGYCGAKMPDNAKVCGACGKPLSRKTQSLAEQNAAASLHSPRETAAAPPKKGFFAKKETLRVLVTAKAARLERHLHSSGTGLGCGGCCTCSYLHGAGGYSSRPEAARSIRP